MPIDPYLRYLLVSARCNSITYLLYLLAFFRGGLRLLGSVPEALRLSIISTEFTSAYFFLSKPISVFFFSGYHYDI